MTSAWLTPEKLNQWSALFADFIEQLEVVDAGHDSNHVKRVVKSALQFAEAEGAELAVVLPAAWLHDCVPVAKNSPLRDKASQLSAEKAVQLLLEWNYPDKYHEAIAHAITAHSYSANVPCETLEAKVVQDADRMDALGAIGIARALVVGASFGNPLTFHEDPFCYDRTPDDKLAIVDHFYTKILKLKDSFHTPAASREALKRHEFMVQFLKQLEAEITIIAT
jgi:uncharacterized protein